MIKVKELIGVYIYIYIYTHTHTHIYYFYLIFAMQITNRLKSLYLADPE